MRRPFHTHRTRNARAVARSVARQAARQALPTLLLLGLPAAAAAQQFVTDDAELVGAGACQMEGWHGEAASWLLPACQPVRNLELTAGVGLLREDDVEIEYVVQGKYLLRALEPGGVGVALVAGLGFGPLSQIAGDGLGGAFAYVPVSVSVAGDRLVLHGNLGWHHDRHADVHRGVVHADSHHALTWAARADLLLPLSAERFTLIGELFGEDRVKPEYQLGLRSVLVPERLLLDLSGGGHTARGFAGPGWAVGLAWTPPPFR